MKEKFETLLVCERERERELMYFFLVPVMLYDECRLIVTVTTNSQGKLKREVEINRYTPRTRKLSN